MHKANTIIHNDKGLVLDLLFPTFDDAFYILDVECYCVMDGACLRAMTYGEIFIATLNGWGLFESDDMDRACFRGMTYRKLSSTTLNGRGLFQSDDVWRIVRCHTKWMGYLSRIGQCHTKWMGPV